MKNFEEPAGEVKELIDRFLDDTLSDSDMERLDRLLNDSPPLRTFFLNYCQLHIELGVDEAVEQRAEKVFDAFCQNKRKAVASFPVIDTSMVTNPFATLIAAFRQVIAPLVCRPAIVFLLGAVTALLAYEIWPRENGKANRLSMRNGTNNASVAYLASVNGCSWTGAPEKHFVGSDVQAGDEISLEEGIAEFRLANGVIASVEGPAALMLGAPSTLVLQHGKLTLRIPWSSKDFCLFAGDCRVIATDAEIGVSVAKGRVEVHSFAGETRLMPVLFSENTNTSADFDEVEDDAVRDYLPAVVNEGRAAVWLAGGVQTDNLLADRSKFASKLSMGGYLPATQQYVDAVLAAKPVSYWRFESIENRRVINEVPGAQPLAVVGEVDLSGDVRNRSLELGSTAETGHLVSDSKVPLSGKNYTLEVWCKPSHFHRGTLLALGFEPPPKPKTQIIKHAVILQTMRDDDRYADVLRNLTPGGVRFLHRNPPTRDPRTGTSCYTSSRYQLRRWQHIVAVKKDAAMRVYIDGVLSGKAEDSTDIADGLHVMIGKAVLRKHGSLPARAFCGQLDELAIYDRALDEAEVVSHFKAIDFTPSKSRSKKNKALESGSEAENLRDKRSDAVPGV